MKYATLLTSTENCVYILSLELKVLKLKEGISNTRFYEYLGSKKPDNTTGVAVNKYRDL